LCKPLVETIKEKCRVCYTCVRECPAKAIRIENGQAEVIPLRCIGCGNCVVVCSQNAKKYQDSKSEVNRIFDIKDAESVAILAPSCPSEFTDISDYQTFVGMLKKLGFTYVNEVAFGAEIVAQKYSELFDNENQQLKNGIITSTEERGFLFLP